MAYMSTITATLTLRNGKIYHFNYTENNAEKANSFVDKILKNYDHTLSGHKSCFVLVEKITDPVTFLVKKKHYSFSSNLLNESMLLIEQNG